MVGSVSLLGAASLLVIRYQRQQQVDWIVQRTVARRVTSSIRVAAALEAAVQDTDDAQA